MIPQGEWATWYEWRAIHTAHRTQLPPTSAIEPTSSYLLAVPAEYDSPGGIGHIVSWVEGDAYCSLYTSAANIALPLNLPLTIY